MTSDTDGQMAGTVTPHEAQTRIRRDGAILLDMRGPDEFASAHAEGAVCLPLPDLERRIGDVPTDRPVLVMCQSGKRSARAAKQLRASGRFSVTDVEGGLNAWRAAGLLTEKQAAGIPLERQVRVVAGALVLGFSLAGFLVSAAFFSGTAVVGFLLTATGMLGICPMMSVLKRLPWNRAAGTLK